MGLSAAVRDLAQRYEQRWGTPVGIDIAEVGSPQGQALLRRAARELVANVHKHSRANRIDISMRRGTAATVLQVPDSGIGFDPVILPSRVSQGHIGWASLVAAGESVGGAVDFSPPASGGTVVTVSVPDELDGGA